MKLIRLTSFNAVKVDDEDYDILNSYSWSENCSKQSHTTYAHARINGIPTYMHRLIMKATKGVYVDHNDGDGLNNQKFNLKLVSHQINMFNRRNRDTQQSKYYGVFKQKDRKHWRSAVKPKNSERIYCGSFKTEIEAALAYNRYIDMLSLTDHPRNIINE